jgi:hypothetical protein
MTAEERVATGFPVEVAVFDRSRIKARLVGGTDDNPVYAFTLEPDSENDGIFCDATGERPGSIAWGMTLDPVLNDDKPLGSSSAIYMETTGPELLHLIACLQNLYDVNYDADGNLKGS